MAGRAGRIHLMIVVLLLALATDSLGATAFAQSGQPPPAEAHLIRTYQGGIERHTDAEFVPGEILVGYHRDRVAEAGFHAQLDMEAVETLDLRGLDGATGDAGVTGHVMRVPVGAEWETIEALLDDPAVAFVTPNWVVRAADVGLVQNEIAAVETPFEVTDTFYAEQQWYLQRINAGRAWQLALEQRTVDGPRIRVAVIDSGIYAEHGELGPYVLPGANYITPGTAPIDDFGHGTRVAGLIGATFNNGSGIAGVAPWIEIDPYKVLGAEGGGSISDVAAAIQEATDNDADIINLSLTSPDTSDALAAALRRANVSNVLMIGAAGNCQPNCSVQYPAKHSEVLAVAATNYDDEQSNYSAVGPEIEIAAPGGEQTSTQEQVFSTWSRDPDATCGTGLVLEGEDVYCYGAGTSAAGAIVAGAAALIWGLDPSMPSEAVRAVLVRTAAPLPLDAQSIGSGRVDLHAAVRSVTPRDLLPSAEAVYAHSTAGTEPFTATVALTNPSSNEVAWQAAWAAGAPWVALAGSDPSMDSGSVRYGEPAYLSLFFSPDLMTAEMDIATLLLSGEVDDGRLNIPLDAILDMYPNLSFLPNMAFQSSSGTPFKWSVPASPGDRETFVMYDGSNREVQLPFDFPVSGENYQYARIHSDGYVTMPSDDFTSLPDSYCLSSADRPHHTIFGWLADLDPGQLGARVSGFNVGDEQYVLEYLNVPSASGVEPSYTVSFQIVLDADGDVRLSYLDVPHNYHRPPQAAVGIETVDGRFRNFVFCNDGETTLGITPHSAQTLLFTPGELY